jgi:hypothetical protein
MFVVLPPVSTVMAAGLKLCRPLVLLMLNMSIFLQPLRGSSDRFPMRLVLSPLLARLAWLVLVLVASGPCLFAASLGGGTGEGGGNVFGESCLVGVLLAAVLLTAGRLPLVAVNADTGTPP